MNLGLPRERKSSDLKRKYLGQLTLQVIESEGGDQLKISKLADKNLLSSMTNPIHDTVPENINEETIESQDRLYDDGETIQPSSNPSYRGSKSDWR